MVLPAKAPLVFTATGTKLWVVLLLPSCSYAFDPQAETAAPGHSSEVDPEIQASG